jgi:hypothetical protein
MGSIVATIDVTRFDDPPDRAASTLSLAIVAAN